MPLSYIPLGWDYPGLRDFQQHKEGLGDASQTVAASGTIAASTLTIPAVASSLGISTAFIPIVGPAIAGLTFAITAWLNRKGPKQKEATTRFVNDAEPLLQENLATFLSSARTQKDKDFALAVFDRVWGEVVAACSQSSMGNPGKACIQDRQAGACQWKEGGECWNWFTGYRDPIASAQVVSEGQALTAGAAGIFAPLLGGNWMALLGGGLVLVALASATRKGRG